MARAIPLSDGREAIVDDSDYEWLSKFKWTTKKWKQTPILYAHRNFRENGKLKTRTMHRVLMGIGDPRHVDHINGDGLDNRRENLRFATRSENMRNRAKRKRTSSRFKGVSWDKENRKWSAHARKDDKQILVGRFKREEEAAIAYNRFVKEIYGEFARPNVVVCQ